MKLKFGKGARRVFEVNINTDYFLDNGACIQILTTDYIKKQFADWWGYTYFLFSKTKFQKLLNNGFIKKLVGKYGHLTCYGFTEKANNYIGEFK